ncbi:response regulator [Sphingobacteruim zhuxiongii]|nr:MULTISPECIES: response regulator [unclassified Sphingobacterium]
MFKLKSTRLQAIVSIIVATLVIIFSYWYFTAKQKEYTGAMKEYMDLAQEKFYLIQDWEVEIQRVSKFNSLNQDISAYSRERARANINSTLEKLAATNALFDSIPKSVEPIRSVSESILDKSDLNAKRNLDTISNHLSDEQEMITNASNQMTNEVIATRSEKTNLKLAKLESTRTITLLSGIVSLLVILYVIYQIMKLSLYLSKTTAAERKLNAEFQKTTDQLEELNWVLQNSAKVYNTVNGNLSEHQIANNSLTIVREVLASHASAFYIRKIDSYELTLRDTYGLDSKQLLKTLLIGEGLVGTVAETKTAKVLDITELDQVKLSTGIIASLPAKVILFPIVFEDYCIGVLEVFGSFPSEREETILSFLGRAGRAIGSAIKSRQDQSLVEDLLTETQQQTEELEAQQEELRITNEELVYKTNLLEASEEELRVQQEELSQANKELNVKAAELETRNNDLKSAQQVVEQKIAEVEQASKYKSEFMANMSHELRTPLNSILILAKLLQDNKQKNLSEDQIKYSSVIYNAGSDLLQLINELLDLAKIESGKVDLNKETILSKEFANNIDSLFKEIADDKKIDFKIDLSEAPTEFITDEYRLEQVTKNFLSNAFKFTEKNGQVNLKIYLNQNNLNFTVTDSGIGISKEKQSLIFEAFRQEDGSTSRKYGGTGLGLSISKEIASLLGGRITLESEPNVGSKFTLIIPFEAASTFESEAFSSIPEVTAVKDLPTPVSVKPEELKKEPSVETKESSTERVILIIEDDVNFSEILKSFSENYGFTALQAYDGETGIQLAKSKLPDAIILDVMLPIADGWEVLKTLKNDEETKHIPIHMMSAASFDKKEFLEDGAIGFMSKPVSEASIQSAFENINLNLNKGVKKILLIEDQEFQSDLIKKAFAEQQINVIQAFTVESGLKKLEQEENFDCIILDIKLPDGSGLEMLDKIKSDKKYEKLPVIINTAYDLSTEQTERIMRHTQSMVLKSSKSNTRLTDEVNLFLNKLTESSYNPVKNMDKIGNHNSYGKSNLEGKCVLIADDDMRNVFALTSSLQQYNMQIEIANNGREAVQLVSDPENKIDIVLMDIMMPEMDGYEAIQLIRKDKKNNNLPIIAVTAKAMKGDREKSIELGASDYVSKPIDIDKLVSLMQVWLS